MYSTTLPSPGSPQVPSQDSSEEKTEINLLNIAMLNTFIVDITDGLNKANQAGNYTIQESHDLLNKIMAVRTGIDTLNLFQQVATKQNQVFQKNATSGEVSRLEPVSEEESNNVVNDNNIKVVELA
jgi:restriction endonuclease Mrr